MEILYPAGNIEYVKSAVKVGANAVYGGLKLWNARNKATNFGIEELKDAIKLCHKNNMKFYLTLNTLMFDSEIEQVIKILKENQIVPDAFICADVGLMTCLKQNFKNIPIHMSTQFGIHNKQDALFAQDFGTERIILARELKKSEILDIKDATNLEVEIFVWGSQCISFSGSCFLGSFVNGGTANRGKCITLCRDRYQINNELGNFLYVPDLNCIKEIDFPVDSIKMEGRRRNISELESVVADIKNKANVKTNNGFIISELPEYNHLYEKVNSRQKHVFKHKTNSPVDSNDVWVKSTNGELEYVDTPDKDSFYVYSEIKVPFLPNKKNLSLDCTIKENKIEKILFLNHKGEAHYFNETFDSAEYVEFDFQGFLNKINLNDVNLYSIKYKKEYESQKPQISCKLLNTLTDYIENLYKNKPDTNIAPSQALKTVYIETDNFETAKQLLSKNIPTILYLADINCVERLNTQTLSGEIIFKLPMFDFKNKGWDFVLEKLKGKKIMLTKFSQLKGLKVADFEKVYADYLIPVWNKKSIGFLNKYGIDCFCTSPELSNNKNLNLFKDAKEVMFLVGGRPSCVYTRQCFKFPYKCGSCNSCIKALSNHDRDLNLNLKCYGLHRELYYDAKVLNHFSSIGKNCTFRYIARDEDINLLEKIYKTLKSENYFKILKSTQEFKNSYSMSLEEDKNEN